MIARAALAVLTLLSALLAAVPAEAGRQRCAVLNNKESGAYLPNTCHTCRVIDVTRFRRDGSMPSNRTYTVPARSTIKLNITARGRMSIKKDAPCEGASRPKDAPRGGTLGSCVALTSKPGMGPVVANSCGACRKAVIARLYGDGSRKDETLVIGANSVVSLDAKGALRGVVIGESACQAQ